MGRLIDAGDVMKSLKAIWESNPTAKVDIGSMILLIGEQPTSYDVEKVVGEIKSWSPKRFDMNDVLQIDKSEAINIVKRGGVDER